MRDGRFRQPDDGGQIGDAQLAVRQRIDEADARRIAEDGERGGQLFGGALVEERPGRGRVSGRAGAGGRGAARL